MPAPDNKHPKIYRKLIRDKIPQIIRRSGALPVTRKISGAELRQAIGRKILEEAYELFGEWQRTDQAGILKESADVMEIILAALDCHGLTADDLMAEKQRRLKARGGFSKSLLLESVDGADDTRGDGGCPAFVAASGGNLAIVQLVADELVRSDMAWVASAFYNPGGINMLLPALDRFFERGGTLKMLISTMGGITLPRYIKHLRKYIGSDHLKVFHPPDLPFVSEPPNFHSKAYLFRRRTGEGAMLIGSSNFTRAGFAKNIEWNYFSPNEVNLPFETGAPFEAAVAEFERTWSDSAVAATDSFLEAYEMRIGASESGVATWGFPPERHEVFETELPFESPGIEPNEVQRTTLENLAHMHAQGLRRAAVVAATGVGKTFLAAMDFEQSDCERLLFIAHRETILQKSMESFRQVMGKPNFGLILGGGNGHVTGDSTAVFAMIQTLSREGHLGRFSPNAFDYIVVDEYHHSEAATYRRVLDHFKPKFMLGLTATPERTDGRDVLALCDYNLACEVRLLEAVDRGWLAPFQYYAIHDETDYNQITWRGTRYDEAELDRALSNDTRTDIVVHNLKRFLPATGKVKALAFCASVAHAQYTAKQIHRRHGIEALALVGESTSDERSDAIARLSNENDPLAVICTVDIFNEGVDIPELSHVLLLRPTQSFTIFLQQLGRGLRKAPGKEFLVPLDFVGNFRQAHVAPMCLAGFTDAQSYVEAVALRRTAGFSQSLPQGCYLDADTEVLRVWDAEIRKIIDRNTKKEDRLKAMYLEVVDDLGGRSPTLLDFFADGRDLDPYVFMKVFGSWLKAKRYCEEELSAYESHLLGTPGEAFLSHLETELNPVRCYKMVVLKTLLEMPGTAWSVKDIARKFLDYFLRHPDRIFDYDDLAKAPDPASFPLRRIVSKLKSMPLQYLSNKEDSFFILDRNAETFCIKADILPYWEATDYRGLVGERVEFTLLRYFRRKGFRIAVPWDEKIFDQGFSISLPAARRLLDDKVPTAAAAGRLLLHVGAETFHAETKRSSDGRNLEINYLDKADLGRALNTLLPSNPQPVDTAFFLSAENTGLRLISASQTGEIPGFKAEIPYNKNSGVGYAAEFRQQISLDPTAVHWTIHLKTGGYGGDMDIEVNRGGTFTAWTSKAYSDKSRFPARIRAAATALNALGMKGEYRIRARGKTLEIGRKFER